MRQQLLAFHHAESLLDVAVFFYIHRFDCFCTSKGSSALSGGCVNETSCYCPGGCGGNIPYIFCDQGCHILVYGCLLSSASDIMFATGPGNLPAVRVQTRRMVRFGSTTVEKPDPLLLGGPNVAPYPATHGFRRVSLDQSGPISCFAFRVVQFIVAFIYLTVNCKTSTMVCRCSFWMNWLPLCSKYVVKRSLPNPENERQRSVDNFRSCILGIQSGRWLQLVRTEVLATFRGKSRSATLPAHHENERRMSINDLRSHILGNVSGA